MPRTGVARSTSAVIQAAGVVMVRDNDGRREVLLTHRAEHHDWVLPQGRLDPGEHSVTAAIRECDEQTGITPTLQIPLLAQAYSDEGRPVVVHYWRARERCDEGFTVDAAIDEVRWIPADVVADYLHHPGATQLVRSAAVQPETVPLIILRHTQAMKRAHFPGEQDSLRPLSGKGRSGSKALVPLLEAFGIDTVYSSSATRCIQTTRPYAKQRGADVNQEPCLTEEEHRDDPHHTADRARELLTLPTALVLCTHRPVLPGILDALGPELGLDLTDRRWAGAWDPRLPPGGFIVIHRVFTAHGGMRAIGLERHSITAM